jgi:hypothetical protein
VLTEKNCCLRNYLIQNQENVSEDELYILTQHVGQGGELDEIPEIQDFCLFPESLIEVVVSYYVNLLDPEINEIEFQKLDNGLNSIITE